MKLKTLIALDILNNSAASAQQLEWAKMTDEEKLAARQKEENSFVNRLNKTTREFCIYFVLILIAISFWYITIPGLIIYIIWKVNHRKSNDSEKEQDEVSSVQ